jgi:hopanoid biosynthesis associated protein HpnK
MTRRLIVTADDFGRAVPINEAVEDAHRRGILTAASLMMGGGAATADAIERARRLPNLAVGLHLTLVDGAPMLPTLEVSDLLASDGRFTRRLVDLGTRLYLNQRVRRQAAAEMRAQFEAFRATGLPLSHVDSHHHYHLHPTVFDLLLPLAVEFGAPAIRIPWEPPRPGSLGSLVNGLFHLRRVLRMRRQMTKAGLIGNDRVFGIIDSGAMDAQCLAERIDELPEGLSELYTHPATRGWDKHPLPPTYRSTEEYAALIDPAIAEKVVRAGITLTTYPKEAARRRRAE